jgi:hypothetical protein
MSEPDEVDPFMDDRYFSALHEAAHCVVGRHLGWTCERIVLRPMGRSAVYFSNVRDHASRIVVLYAAGEMERKAGAEYLIDGDDLRTIDKLVEDNGFKKHHLEALKRIARRLVDINEPEIHALCLQLHVPGVYRFRGDRLVYVDRIR